MMGITPSQHHVHARELNGYWQPTALASPLSAQDAPGVFKREVYAFALRNQEMHDIKGIYWYCGMWRLAKCSRLEEEMRIIIQFRSPEVATQFKESEERLGPGRFPLCSRRFNQDWQLDHSACTEDKMIFR